MNFYKHHIGDYAQATAHLSFVEDAAYSRMIRKYYAEEKPLPADIKAIQRLIGARTREEKQAVEDILREFFTQESDGWHNKRCDSELERANAQAETNRRIAEEREAKRRARMEDGSSTNRQYSQNGTSNDSLHDSSASREPSQTPDSRHQTPEIKPSSASPPSPAPLAPPLASPKQPKGSRLPDDWKLPKLWGDWAMEDKGLSADQVRTEADKFADYWRAKPGKDAVKLDWLATWRNWIRNAAERIPVREGSQSGSALFAGVI